MIEFLHLNRVAHDQAGNLSGGQKKLLELGRTMMVEAKVVLLDEVGAGVNRTLLQYIGDAIVRLNQEGLHLLHDRARHGLNLEPCDPVIVSRRQAPNRGLRRGGQV